MADIRKTPISDEEVALIRQQAEGLRYGTLSLVFQDGLLIQIDRNEKLRVQSTDKKNRLNAGNPGRRES